MNGQRIVTMFFSLTSRLMTSDAVQSQISGQSQWIKGFIMKCFDLFFNIFYSNTAYTADGIGKVAVDHFFADTDGLKDLRAHVGLNGGNTHLGCNLNNTVKHCCIVIIHCCIIILIQHLAVNQFMDGILSQIRVDGTGTIAQQGCKMMYFSWFTGFQNDGQ